MNQSDIKWSLYEFHSFESEWFAENHLRPKSLLDIGVYPYIKIPHVSTFFFFFFLFLGLGADGIAAN